MFYKDLSRGHDTAPLCIESYVHPEYGPNIHGIACSSGGAAKLMAGERCQDSEPRIT